MTTTILIEDDAKKEENPAPPADIATKDENIEAIMKQLEYYFSEENLNKDKFLTSKMDERYFVPIELLGTFRRMQPYVKGSQDIVTAASLSDQLELNESKTAVRHKTNRPPTISSNTGGSSVKRRRTAFVPKHTLYVRDLDPRVTEEILYELFIQVGPVNDVFIPSPSYVRYSGFGFVEFAPGPLCTARQSMDFARSILDGIKLFGKPIRVLLRSDPDNPQSQLANTQTPSPRVIPTVSPAHYSSSYPTPSNYAYNNNFHLTPFPYPNTPSLTHPVAQAPTSAYPTPPATYSPISVPRYDYRPSPLPISSFPIQNNPNRMLPLPHPVMDKYGDINYSTERVNREKFVEEGYDRIAIPTTATTATTYIDRNMLERERMERERLERQRIEEERMERERYERQKIERERLEREHFIERERNHHHYEAEMIHPSMRNDREQERVSESQTYGERYDRSALRPREGIDDRYREAPAHRNIPYDRSGRNYEYMPQVSPSPPLPPPPPAPPAPRTPPAPPHPRVSQHQFHPPPSSSSSSSRNYNAEYEENMMDKLYQMIE